MKGMIAVGTYHVFGSGSSATSWRPQQGAQHPLDFFARLDLVKTDAGDNGFVGHYAVPADFDFGGWEVCVRCYPPSDQLVPTGYKSRREWMEWAGTEEAAGFFAPLDRVAYQVT